MPRRPRPPGPKRIVYLWGAGATQAEISAFGSASVNLLMRNNASGEGVASRIIDKLERKWQKYFLSEHGTDIEKLISLLNVSGVASFEKLAAKIRKLYFEDIRNSLSTTGVLGTPKLATALFALHANERFREIETLSGFITTNHDGLLQVASQAAHGAVNIGIPFASTDLTSADAAPPILQLHGSFTWSFGVPIRVTTLTELSKYAVTATWIPPSTLKESKAYPFNKLAGSAYEMLAMKCDVLRVVGSSLTQNDWNVLSMIFNAQRHVQLTKEHPFRVELIMPHDVGEALVKECSYLTQMSPIGTLSEGDLGTYKDATPDQIAVSEMSNPLLFWLKQKIQFHRNNQSLGDPPLHPALMAVMGEEQ